MLLAIILAVVLILGYRKTVYNFIIGRFLVAYKAERHILSIRNRDLESQVNSFFLNHLAQHKEISDFYARKPKILEIKSHKNKTKITIKGTNLDRLDLGNVLVLTVTKKTIINNQKMQDILSIARHQFPRKQIIVVNNDIQFCYLEELKYPTPNNLKSKR